MLEKVEEYCAEFQSLLERFNKDAALDYAMTLLQEGKVTVPQLYEGVLAPALNSIAIPYGEETDRIWREHLMTGIVRSVIECAYPFVRAERDRLGVPGRSGKAIVLCPEEEYHELGARMGADFLTIAGYAVSYIGCNTPRENFLPAYLNIRPDLVAISVTNPLNLVALKRIAGELREKAEPVVIAACGSAVGRAGGRAMDYGADVFINTYADALALGR